MYGLVQSASLQAWKQEVPDLRQDSMEALALSGHTVLGMAVPKMPLHSCGGQRALLAGQPDPSGYLLAWLSTANSGLPAKADMERLDVFCWRDSGRCPRFFVL